MLPGLTLLSMKCVFAAVIAGLVIVGGVASPSSARRVHAEVYSANQCVTNQQVNRFPFNDIKDQAAAERWLQHPARRGNPSGSDYESYSVQYKMCGKRWNKAGFYLYYQRSNRHLQDAMELEMPAGTLDTFPHAPAGPSLPGGPAFPQKP